MLLLFTWKVWTGLPSDPVNQIGLALGKLVLVCFPLATDDRRAIYIRLYPLHIARATFVLPARDIRAVQLPLLSQAALVTHRRRRLLSLCGSQEVMDNPDANHHRFRDALDVVYRPGADGQRLCINVLFRLVLMCPDTRQPNM